jgi:hypothetical protein
MDALHVIIEPPLPRKTITWDSAFTALKNAKKRFLSVSVHVMDLKFMSTETGSRRKKRVLTRIDLATVRLKMRIDEFAAAFS